MGLPLLVGHHGSAWCPSAGGFTPPRARTEAGSPVPLVLLDALYRPYTDRQAPISGIDGDVRDPSNILWLRTASADSYVQSLAHAGVVQLDVHD